MQQMVLVAAVIYGPKHRFPSESSAGGVSACSTSSSYGKLERLAPLHQTALNARKNAKLESRHTEKRQAVHQLRLLPEVANIVPIDPDLELSFEGDECMEGMLNVQAVLSQPELALLWHKAEARAIPCLDQCLKALTFSYDTAFTYAETLTIATLELFCEEVDSYFTSCMSLLLVNSVFMRILFNLYRLNVPSGLQAVQESHHCQVSQPTVIQSY